MTIYQESRDFLEHMFSSCTTSQISEFIPEKRGFRLHGHSTTVTLERAFWNVVEAMAQECGLPVPRLIERVLDSCIVANDKNLSSCLRVICLKYLNIYTAGSIPASPEQRSRTTPS
ncbi:MAG: ribbon-helix-helix domain-containing protein [Burkholderiaceae bacterium]|nr:ribbon-helix-helix domain-containing protein [Burkholderiaceae bacterium]